MGVWASRPSSMFGGKISDHLDKDGVNKFVKWSVEEIERTGQGLRTDALYRASGGHDKVQRIGGQPERGMLELLHQERNVHVLTGALKQFFRSLKQPILRIEEFQDVLKGRENGNDCSDRLVQIIKNVPKLQRPTLAYFFKHLFRVMHELENNMSLASLGVVFGPTLMRVGSSMRTEGVVSLQSSIEDLNLVVELLLQHYAKVFEDDLAELASAPHVQPPPNTSSEGDTTEGFSRSELHAEDGNQHVTGCTGAGNEPSSNVGKTSVDDSSSHHEAHELGPEAASASGNQQLVRDSPVNIETCDFEILSTTSNTGETPSLVSPTTKTPRTRNSKSTSSTLSDDFREDFGSFTTLQESPRRSSATLDDPMCKSSDSDDIDSVLAHMAKALSPEHGNVSDVEPLSTSWSSGTTTSRGSSDITAVEVLPDRALPTTDAATGSAVDDLAENSAVYHLTAPRISIIERDHSSLAGVVAKPRASWAVSDADQAVVQPNSQTDSILSREIDIDADPNKCSVQDKILLFTKKEDNAFSLKKQKSIANEESEEDKKVKTEFEETFEKVTQQKK